MWIQIIVSFFAFFVLLRIAINFHQRKVSGFSTVLWTVVWACVLVIFWSPEIASRLALVFGIGRGADLIVYVAIIVIVYVVYRIFARLERIERQITQISRAVALHDDGKEKNDHRDTDTVS